MTAATPARGRRERTASESLLSLTLVLEAIVVFFVALTVFGLELLPAGIALGGGAALILILVIDARLVGKPAGIWIGWALQAVLIMLGLLTPVMWFVGAGFAGLWVFCFLKGRQLDRAKAAYFAANSPPPAGGTSAPSTPTPAPDRPEASERPAATESSKETE